MEHVQLVAVGSADLVGDARAKLLAVLLRKRLDHAYALLASMAAIARSQATQAGKIALAAGPRDPALPAAHTVMAKAHAAVINTSAAHLRIDAASRTAARGATNVIAGLPRGVFTTPTTTLEGVVACPAGFAQRRTIMPSMPTPSAPLRVRDDVGRRRSTIGGSKISL